LPDNSCFFVAVAEPALSATLAPDGAGLAAGFTYGPFALSFDCEAGAIAGLLVSYLTGAVGAGLTLCPVEV